MQQTEDRRGGGLRKLRVRQVAGVPPRDNHVSGFYHFQLCVWGKTSQSRSISHGVKRPNHATI